MKYILILFSFYFCINIYSQSNFINCIQTENNGDITINWSPVDDPLNSFVSYDIVSFENGNIGNENIISNTSITIPAINQSNTFYIQSNFSSGVTYSDTFSNIFLSLNNPLDGTAVLQWNNPSPKVLENYFKIYREYPLGNWVFIDSVPYGTSYFVDTIDICESFLNYQVKFENKGCDFTSNIEGATFKDKISPDIPEFTSISFDTLTGHVSINWTPTTQNDTYGYIIYKLDENGFSNELDTIYGQNSSNYTYLEQNISTSLSFTIAAFDSCYVNGVGSTFQTSAKGEINSSVFCASNIDICSKKITLNWSEYSGWETSNYIIYLKEEDGFWRGIDTTEYLQYIYTGQPYKNYTFAIKANSIDNISAFSNLVSVFVSAPTQPSINYIESVSVENNNVELKHFIELTNGVKELSFQKKNSKGVFEEFERIVPISNRITIIDNEVEPSRQSYSYQVVVIDSCDNLGDSSNIAETIFLKSYTENNTLTHFLDWNSYDSFEGSLIEYQLYKGDDGIFQSNPYILLNNNQHFYNDKIESTNFSGKSCYYVEAIESSNIYGNSERSKSNIICPIVEPIIYIPNSFTPNGDAVNPVFRPIFSFVEIESYSLEIFNRWEQLIYQTSNYRDGWDGSLMNSNKKAVEGMYIYQLKLNSGDGVQHIKRGIINLIR